MKRVGQIIIFAYMVIPTFLWSYEEKSLVVVVPSYNNSQWYKKNLDSIFNQQYNNYHVMYIDDCSTDDTYILVADYIKQKHLEDKITLIHNKKRLGALANHYKVVHMCRNDQIIVQLDGDDWFKHEKVLAKVNNVYQDKNIWLTYGQFECFPDGRKGECRQIESNIVKAHAFREDTWVTSALRTFYAGLFKQIKLQDLLDQGIFFLFACDYAFMLPMLEMASGHIHFIDEILYVYNCANPINDFKKDLKQQLHCSYIVRSKEKYFPLDEPPYLCSDENYSINIFLFSDNGCKNIESILRSINANIFPVKEIYVFYHVAQSMDIYKKLIKDFPIVKIVLIDRTNFKSLLEKKLYETSSEYIVCLKDTLKVNKSIDVSRCIQLMRQTKAYCFHLSLGINQMTSLWVRRPLNLPPLIEIDQDIYAWQYKYGEHLWAKPRTFIMTLYHKVDLLKSFSDLLYDSCDALEYAWQTEKINVESLGLCHAESIITII